MPKRAGVRARRDGDRPDDPSQDERSDDVSLEVLMRSARVFAAITAESIARAGDVVTPPQLRVLVLAAHHGPLNNTAVAADLNVHLSNASRISDRLVQAGLLNRRDSPTDRRNVELTLTDQGQQLVNAVLEHRRSALTEALQRMRPASRDALVTALDEFNAVAESQDRQHRAD